MPSERSSTDCSAPASCSLGPHRRSPPTMMPTSSSRQFRQTTSRNQQLRKPQTLMRFTHVRRDKMKLIKTTGNGRRRDLPYLLFVTERNATLKTCREVFILSQGFAFTAKKQSQIFMSVVGCCILFLLYRSCADCCNETKVME